MRATDIYQTSFKNKKDKIPATFDIISITGWTPHKNQQKALRPGSGKIRLETIFKTK